MHNFTLHNTLANHQWCCYHVRAEDDDQSVNLDVDDQEKKQGSSVAALITQLQVLVNAPLYWSTGQWILLTQLCITYFKLCKNSYSYLTSAGFLFDCLTMPFLAA